MDKVDDLIPCRYVVVKYVPDQVRNEPFNVGVILQSEDNVSRCRFVTEQKRKITRTLDIESTFLYEISAKIESVVLESNKADIINKLMEKYGGKVQFSEVRGTLTSSIEDEIEWLYDEFVKPETKPENILITNEAIANDLKRFVDRYILGHPNEWKIQKEVRGVFGDIKFDALLTNLSTSFKMYFQAISFELNKAVTRLKVFDWDADDIRKVDNHMNVNNFGAIIYKPRETIRNFNQKYDAYKLGRDLINDKGYHVIEYYPENRKKWQEEIELLVSNNK